MIIETQRNAVLSPKSKTAMQDRNRHIRAIRRHGRRQWYKRSGFSQRSMVENTVYRYKQIIGPEMRARTLAGQRVEHRIGCEILNRMTALGMPDTYCVGKKADRRGGELLSRRVMQQRQPVAVLVAELESQIGSVGMDVEGGEQPPAGARVVLVKIELVGLGRLASRSAFYESLVGEEDGDGGCTGANSD